jgi:excisionase family DNA binding protein
MPLCALQCSCVKRQLQNNGGMEMQEQLAVSIPEAARRLGLSIRTVATLVARRELRSRKVGRRRIIPVAALESFIRGDPRTLDVAPPEAKSGTRKHG